MEEVGREMSALRLALTLLHRFHLAENGSISQIYIYFIYIYIGGVSKYEV